MDTPEPSSATSISSLPYSFSFTWSSCMFCFELDLHLTQTRTGLYTSNMFHTSMFVARASRAFSTNSLTAVARSTTTCPLEILWMTSCDTCLIRCDISLHHMTRGLCCAFFTGCGYLQACWSSIYDHKLTGNGSFSTGHGLMLAHDLVATRS